MDGDKGGEVVDSGDGIVGLYNRRIPIVNIAHYSKRRLQAASKYHSRVTILRASNTSRARGTHLDAQPESHPNFCRPALDGVFQRLGGVAGRKGPS